MKYGKILPQCEIQGFVFDRKISTYFGRKNRRHIINWFIIYDRMWLWDFKEGYLNKSEAGCFGLMLSVSDRQQTIFR